MIGKDREAIHEERDRKCNIYAKQNLSQQEPRHDNYSETLMQTLTKLVNVKKEPFDICIMRPGYYQNKYVIGIHGTREEVVKLFEDDFIRRMKTDSHFRYMVHRLAGKTIGCCCAPDSCHGDVYIKYFNGGYDNELKN